MATWDKVRVVEGIAAGLAATFGDVRQVQENMEAMAIRAAGAPIVQPVERVVFMQADGDDTWTPPATVSAFTVYAYGGGGPNNASGTESSKVEVTYDSTTIVGGGGFGGINNAGGAAGVATGGDINLNGREGANEGSSINARAPAPGPFGSPDIGDSAVAGNPAQPQGGSGACAIKRFVVTSGDVDITFTEIGNGPDNAAVIIEY